MAPPPPPPQQQLVRLPDGQEFAVSPVFAGVGFRSLAHRAHDHAYPVGWTVVLHTDTAAADAAADAGPWTRPTRAADSLFISSVAGPPASEARRAASPTRQLAMLLWVTLYWYFHHDPPPPLPAVPGSSSSLPAWASDVPAGAGPVPDWRVRVRPDGALRGRGVLAKLERMGLVACDDSAAGSSSGSSSGAVFVSQPVFWQLPGRLFLFAPEPVPAPDPDPPPPGAGADRAPSPAPAGPFASTSHLPTYFPPAPLRHVVTGGVRHPQRPRPPHPGEVFYSRFVPSVGHFLAFRVASAAAAPVPYRGPRGPAAADLAAAHPGLLARSDAALLEAWHAEPRVAAFWGPYVPGSLDRALAAAHLFPVVGLWDGVPFGYFELYWVKEDLVGRHVGAEVDDFDRGLHLMVGEDWARGRVGPWLTGLVHWCLTADLRTMSVCLEPRVDNHRILRHLDALVFSREKQVALPYKQAWFVRLRRESWQGPAL